ncbi:hypothetical protein [Cellulosilyticum ruminicola]|uniref:hypothetical protein n=1 Tax=Cellulosilyticum ruminicola TaxID=425254 RepID=UPI0006D129EE|nr:hypothetical protein [Cellulosilyticum ruminicola]
MSVSEIMFYEYQDFIERIDNVFANGTHTKVKEGIIVSEVDNLINDKSLQQIKNLRHRDLAIFKLQALGQKMKYLFM